MKNICKLFSCVCVCFLVFDACLVDERYNSDNIKNVDTDMTLFGKGIDIPLGSIGEIRADSLLKMVKDPSLAGMFRTADGKYSFVCQPDKPISLDEDIAKIDLSGIRQVPGSSFSQSTSYSLKDFHKELPEANKSHISMDIPEGKFTQRMDRELKNLQIVSPEAMKALPKQLLEIDSLYLSESNISINLRFSNLPPLNKGDIRISNASVTLPDYIVIGKTFKEGSNIIKIEDQTLSVTDGTSEIRLKAPFAGIKDIVLDGKEALTGNILMSGELSVNNTDIDLSSLSSDIIADFDAFIGNAEKPSKENPGKIIVRRIVGKMGYNLGDDVKPSEISLAQLPDFLKEEGTCLDLNQIITLNVKTNLGLPIKGKIVFTPLDRDGNVIKGKDGKENTVILDNIQLPYSYTAGKEACKTFVIGKDASDISRLISRMPDRIRAEIIAGTDKDAQSVLEPDATYYCHLDYKFEIPVMFGDDFALKTTTEDLPFDEKIGKYLSMAAFLIEGDITSTLPVGAELKIKLLDKDNRLSHFLDSYGKDCTEVAVNIDPDTQKGTKPNLSVYLALNNQDKDYVPCKMRLFIDVRTTPNKQLKEDDYIKIENLKFRLPEGITVDPQTLSGR